MTLFYTAKVITDPDFDFFFQRKLGKVTTFGWKNRKLASVMTLFYTAKVITNPDLEFFQRKPRKVTTFGQKNK